MRVVPGPITGFRHADTFAEASGGGEQQGPCDVRGGFDHRRRSVADRHASGSAGFQIDVVHADCVVSDDFQHRSRGIEKSTVDLDGEGGENRGRAADQLMEIGNL